MEAMRGADLLAEYLVKEKVPYVFGLCGHGIVGFMDAIARRQGQIKMVGVHQEQVAGYMADAYFRVAQRPVATFTSCGPGSTNLVIALACAMMDSSAFVAITGNVPTSQFNRGPFQETYRYFQADFPSVIRPYVKRSFQVPRTDMLPLALRQAFKTAGARPAGTGESGYPPQRLRRGRRRGRGAGPRPVVAWDRRPNERLARGRPPGAGPPRDRRPPGDPGGKRRRALPGRA